MTTQYCGRDEEMVSLFMSGKTLAEIGASFFISRQRAHQILKRQGIIGFDGGKFLVNKIAAEKKARDRDERFLRDKGCTYAEYIEIPAGAKRAYRAQKGAAKKREIEWRFTLFEWWGAWQRSGYWQKRGSGGGYCMARRGDVGPYAIDNVYFCTIGQNIKDGYIYRSARARKHNYPPKNHYVVPNHKGFSLWVRRGDANVYHSYHKTQVAAEAEFSRSVAIHNN